MDIEIIKLIAENAQRLDTPVLVIITIFIYRWLNGTKHIWKNTNEKVNEMSDTMRNLPCHHHGERIAKLEGQHTPTMKAVNE